MISIDILDYRWTHTIISIDTLVIVYKYLTHEINSYYIFKNTYKNMYRTNGYAGI